MRKLERKYQDTVAVIGVQSAKYPAEGVPENLAEAVQRLGIEHPVVDDPEYRVWEAYAVNAWPTLVFVSPTGQVIGRHAGEIPFDALDQTAGAVLDAARQAGILAESSPVSVARAERPENTLSFPGKVLAAGDRLYIADSGHHRILGVDLDGTVRAVYGSGAQGLADGAPGEASFDTPQGMALTESTLYVADAGNHAIRAIDRATGAVSTIAGTGRQAARRIRRAPGREVDLSSPWDLALDGDYLYVAMAGLHQIWSIDLISGEAAVFAGTGHEAVRDGPRETAWFAQPMGLTLADGSLYVACAEAQAVRRIDLASGAVTTLVGGGLFQFGDESGPAAASLLQHCQSVAARGTTVYIADTYNNRIKTLDMGTGLIAGDIGSGTAGLLDGPGPGARFWEPDGLSLSGPVLWIADTNNHAIRGFDLAASSVHALRLDWSGTKKAG